MISRVGKIPVLSTITALRGDGLRIDLGKAFEGELFAWMRKNPTLETHREFKIEEGRYLILSKNKTLDYYSNEDVVEAIEEDWQFDVKQTLNSGEENESSKTVYRGTIGFENNVTGDSQIDIFGDDPIAGTLAYEI